MPNILPVFGDYTTFAWKIPVPVRTTFCSFGACPMLTFTLRNSRLPDLLQICKNTVTVY